MAEFIRNHTPLTNTEKQTIKCQSNCNVSGQDVITYEYKQGGTGTRVWREYVMGDIANDMSINCYSTSITYPESGLKEKYGY